MEISASCDNIVIKAVNDAPADEGGGGAGLKGGISKRPSGKIQFDVVSARDYSAYVEFGTGALVRVPSKLQDYAMQFKGAGVRDVNLPARPFFFPAFESERVELIKNIKNVLKDLAR